eukprot:4094469-Pyramimonas_sp.AAC.3
MPQLTHDRTRASIGESGAVVSNVIGNRFARRRGGGVSDRRRRKTHVVPVSCVSRGGTLPSYILGTAPSTPWFGNVLRSGGVRFYVRTSELHVVHVALVKHYWELFVLRMLTGISIGGSCV